MKKLSIYTAVVIFAVLCGCKSMPIQKDAELFESQSKNMKRLTGVMPPEVKTIACIAPGSTPGSKHHHLGVKLLRQAGYNVKIMPHTFVRQPKKNQAPLDGRLADFYAAWNDPEVDMIFCVRGGLGSEELLDNLDWNKLKKRPELYFQGYSDITLILGALTAKKQGHPIAGPMAGSLTGLPSDAIEAMKNMNHGKQVGPVKLETLVKGDCQGIAAAGLLQRFSVLAEKSYCPSNKDKIIFIEAVSISASDVKKHLYNLLEKNFFEGAAGVVFCQFARCNPKEDIAPILREFAPKLGIPVYANFPFGHVARNYSIDLTRRAVIKNGEVTFPEVKKQNK